MFIIGGTGMEIQQLETEHYILRALSISDAPALFEVMKDKETMKYITPHPPESLEKVEERIYRHLEGFQKKTEIPWAIVDKNRGKVIGMFCFHKVHQWHRKAEMGVILHKDYQNRGVMTELMPTILNYGFQVLDFNRIVGDIFTANIASQKLLEKFSFQKEGVFRETDFDGERFHDTAVYSLLKKEYVQLLNQKKI